MARLNLLISIAWLIVGIWHEIHSGLSLAAVSVQRAPQIKTRSVEPSLITSQLDVQIKNSKYLDITISKITCIMII